MSINAIAIIILLLFIFFISIKSNKVIFLKPLILPSICTVFILLLVVFSNTAVESATTGLNLWLHVVFPSLFPFFVASEILNRTGFIKAVGVFLEPIMRPLFNVPGCGSFVFAMGITSGYPVGAKLTTSLREEKLITKTEADRLISFTNNSGPLFIVGAVAVGMFKIPDLGFPLFLCHIFASITVGILFRFYGNKRIRKIYHDNSNLVVKFKKELLNSAKNGTRNLGETLGDSIKSSITVMLSIGGFIILFSVIINILLEIGFISSLTDIFSTLLMPLGINNEIIASLLSGFFEITTGCSRAISTSTTPLYQQLVAVSFILGWAGLSVHSQVYSIICKSDISIKPYLLGKFLQGIFGAIYMLIFLRLSSIFNSNSLSVFYPITITNRIPWYHYTFNSLMNLSISFLILFLLLIISSFINKRIWKRLL